MKIGNRDARRLWLHSQGLSATPTGTLDVMALIRSLGFVQLDTIRNVTRAHHHILWSRNQNYREPMLGGLLRDERAIFEHFTHDASVLPAEYYPYWRRQFRRLGEKVRSAKWFAKGLADADIDAVRARIHAEGALSTKDFDAPARGNKEMWSRPPHKRALDLLWYEGELTTAHREKFIKFYDLSERVIKPEHYGAQVTDADQVDWLCTEAMDRLSFGAPGDIQRFWDAVDAAEVRAWLAGAGDRLMPIEVQAADGSWASVLAPADITTRLQQAGAPTSRLRIINPFDPAVRDRVRLKRLFGFDYRNEIFVPAKDRIWGYYVYPLLEGDRFVGRAEIKADRKKGVLTVAKLWREPRVRWTAARAQKFEAELARFAWLAGIGQVGWACGQHPE